MAGTVIEYLQKYGDISFREKPLNDVDSLALCQLSYLKFDGMVSDVRHNGCLLYTSPSPRDTR